jgi:pyruvate dehydrogenase E2 component (dihydrolipoamide acetyltransferase)
MGVGFFNAILYPPQVGILAVGRAETEPVWIDDEFQPRLRMPLALNFDHRIIDGADGARALSWIVEATEKFSVLT